MKKFILICLVLVMFLPFAVTAQNDSPANIIFGTGNPVAAVTTQKTEDGKVLVKWAVENASLISYMVVERSADGVNYTAVSKKIAANNHINFLENISNAAAVYRVAFVKKDGTKFYGRVDKMAFASTAP